MKPSNDAEEVSTESLEGVLLKVGPQWDERWEALSKLPKKCAKLRKRFEALETRTLEDVTTQCINKCCIGSSRQSIVVTANRLVSTW